MSPKLLSQERRSSFNAIISGSSFLCYFLFAAEDFSKCLTVLHEILESRKDKAIESGEYTLFQLWKKFRADLLNFPVRKNKKFAF